MMPKPNWANLATQGASLIPALAQNSDSMNNGQGMNLGLQLGLATGNPLIAAAGLVGGFAYDAIEGPKKVKAALSRESDILDSYRETLEDSSVYNTGDGYEQWNPSMSNFASGGPTDPPPTGDYNMKRALELGYGPDQNGHWPSRDYRTGEILKSPSHPTFHLGLDADRAEGYRPMVGVDGRVYTISPNDIPQEGPFRSNYAQGGDAPAAHVIPVEKVPMMVDEARRRGLNLGLSADLETGSRSGVVTGPGTGKSDDVPFFGGNVSSGEIIINEQDRQRYFPDMSDEEFAQMWYPNAFTDPFTGMKCGGPVMAKKLREGKFGDGGCVECAKKKAMGFNDGGPVSPRRMTTLGGRQIGDYYGSLGTYLESVFKPYSEMKYGFGKKGQDGMIDCSGGVCRVINDVLGANSLDPNNTTSQSFSEYDKRKEFTPVDRKSIAPGDIVSFQYLKNGKSIGHAGMIDIRDNIPYFVEFSSNTGGLSARPLDEYIQAIGSLNGLSGPYYSRHNEFSQKLSDAYAAQAQVDQNQVNQMMADHLNDMMSGYQYDEIDRGINMELPFANWPKEPTASAPAQVQVPAPTTQAPASTPVQASTAQDQPNTNQEPEESVVVSSRIVNGQRIFDHPDDIGDGTPKENPTDDNSIFDDYGLLNAAYRTITDPSFRNQGEEPMESSAPGFDWEALRAKNRNLMGQSMALPAAALAFNLFSRPEQVPQLAFTPMKGVDLGTGAIQSELDRQRRNANANIRYQVRGRQGVGASLVANEADQNMRSRNAAAIQQIRNQEAIMNNQIANQNIMRADEMENRRRMMEFENESRHRQMLGQAVSSNLDALNQARGIFAQNEIGLGLAENADNYNTWYAQKVLDAQRRIAAMRAIESMIQSASGTNQKDS